MDFDKKSRGQKHHKNKTRYKPKNKTQNKPPEVVQDRKKIVNPVDSTSSEDEEEVDDETVVWNDFSLLAQAPISVGGHFQFKSDKDVETTCDFDNLQQNNLFSLDLNALQYSLNCIPFVERCGLDKSCFTESELEEMNVRASASKVQYENYLISRLKSDSNKVARNTTTVEMTHDLSEQVIETTVLPAVQQSTTKSASDGVQEESTIDHKEEVEVNKAELEDWLDDILGD